MSAYYNEFDPFAAAWLRELIKAEHIAPGDVDERSILEVKPDDLKGYTQCHFFAGIGGWSLALRLAGWPDSRPVWTGSAPCQPFSSAGKQTKQSDERHLWPHWYRLIREYRPATLFGEQVASALAAGWWDDVAHDLETENYACAAAVLPACAVGAPHRRDRLWFVAHRDDTGECGLFGEKTQSADESQGQAQERQRFRIFSGGSSKSLADTQDEGAGRCAEQTRGKIIGDRGAVGHSFEWRPQGQAGTEMALSRFIACADGKQRLVKSGLPLLADGISNRVGKLRGYGNAIVAPLAAEFIKASMGCVHV